MPGPAILLDGNGLWPPLRTANGQEFRTSILITSATPWEEEGVTIQLGSNLACIDQYEPSDASYPAESGVKVSL